MSSRSVQQAKVTKLPRSGNIADWSSVLAVVAWASLLLKYKLTDQLLLLVHPSFNWLVLAASGVLFLAGVGKSWSLLLKKQTPQAAHMTLLPAAWSSWILILSALIGLVTTPQILNSSAAVQQGITENLISSRVKVQSFQASDNPEERSMLDWAKTLMTYPEPDRYVDQTAKVIGFVVHVPQLAGEPYLILTRFVIMHCALDAFPVSLPVKLTGESSKTYPSDTWLEVKGKIIAEVLDGRRQIVIQADSLTPVSVPKEPYEFG
jgi:uncharacterized repeat protein (TIGR03943 family)